MSRRDTIIIAVLVNAGLLIVLFASALKSNPPGHDVAMVPTSPVQEAFVPPAPMKKEAPFVAGDEVDQALHQYAQRAETPVLPVVPEVKSEVNFADDLNAFASAQAPAALPAPVAEQKTPEIIEIRVKKGDVLEKIARHHHTTVADIMKLNHLTTTNLRIGQLLKISSKGPIAAAAARPAAQATQSSAENGPVYYIVKKGDNPWTIAVKNHMKVEELLRLNAMSEDQARRLKPGDQLRIR